ncbi:UDP-glucose 4-epimerase GalE [Streptomyces sp. NPDC051554]|uniref:UDP-glucose 4-epimerase GalE n=1 Tax=Streptomyces sp. NPDC051554 TaxID=3365656 RepID=UPI003788C909
MRVLVTGGAGYVGSFIVRRLLRHNHEVQVIDNLSTGRREAVPEVPLHVVDIRKSDALKEIFSAFAPQAVIHLAGLKSSAESVAHPAKYYDVNVIGMAKLLHVAAAHNVERFIFSSSCAVYGNPEVCPVDEQTPLHPESPYGETKLAGERMLQWHALASQMHYASLRYFNVAGAAKDGSLGEFVHAGSTQLVPRVILAALGRGAPFAVRGGDYPTSDGTALRDYIHVEDLADAHVRVLESLTTSGLSGVYNLGRGYPVSVLEMIEEVERVGGKTIERTFAPRRPGDPAVSWADATLARKTFDWFPRLNLSDIVESSWNWHHSHS